VVLGNALAIAVLTGGALASGALGCTLGADVVLADGALGSVGELLVSLVLGEVSPGAPEPTAPAEEDCEATPEGTPCSSPQDTSVKARPHEIRLVRI
jgi:hypothetical protein